MHAPDHTTKDGERPRVHILIIGCGIGGLSAAYCLGRAGHKITVLERASEISDVGAGIQVDHTTMAQTVLIPRLGAGGDHVLAMRVPVPRDATGERIGWTQWGDAMTADYGAPYYHIHRADLLDMLHTLATPFMTLCLNSKVVAIDPSAACVTLENGDTLSGDLIVGADGLKSVVRTAIVGGPARAPIHTGDSAYRAIVPTAAMRADPALRGLVDSREMVNWMGPEKHIIGYSIRGGAEYNLVLVRPDSAAKESYMAEGSVAQMRADFADWEPRIPKLLHLTEKTYILPLMYREPLDNWVHATNKVVLLGDAAHPTLPSRAQGAAMAVEDAAVLGTLLSHLTRADDPADGLGMLLRAYQALRQSRTAKTQRAARANFDVFHLPDGPAQRTRDGSMRSAALDAAAADGGANVWADRRKSDQQFGYDAEAEAWRWCRDNGIGRDAGASAD
ncbi:FAD/NAD-P-binding domain-containing protein [Mycena pura]|uniref:FAD/NAD-P-binding domain-containing protein n=1 Tax=Mycena pura TaxID=153505 RepID=A0AAD6Y7X9_9AGAR|nr:FAD/NAD-P-binding domain-containing protein [Mycena pura]